MARRIRRILLWAGAVLAALVVLLALAIVGLRLTNPSPSDSPGWTRVADIPDAHGEVAAAIAGNWMVVAGGFRGFGGTSDAVFIYDVESDRWESGPPLPEPRHHSSAAGLGNYAYVSGGSPAATDWTAKTELWRLRPGGRWEARAPMPEGRQGHAMVALDEQLYVIGGIGESAATLVYDPEEDVWTTAAPLPEARDHIRAVTHQGRIWALGGRNGRSTTRVDIYDPERNTWAPGPDLPEPMSAMAVGVLEDEIHVIGGEDPRLFRGNVSDAHYVLEPGAREWSPRPRPLLPVHGAGYAVHGQQLIVTGGASRQGGLSVVSWTPVTQVYSVQRAVMTEAD